MTCQDHVANFYKLIKIKESIIRCNFIVLKYKSQNQHAEKYSCNWFQESNLKETMALLMPEIKEKITSGKINYSASQKTSEIFTITGTTLKLAYHFRDNTAYIKRAVASKTNLGKHPENDNFQSQTMYKMEVVVGIMQIDEKSTGNVSQMLNQQSSLTEEKTVEISHYFSKPTTKPEKLELETNENQDLESDTKQSVKLKEPRVVLRKLVNEGLLKEKNRKVKKSRLTTKKRTAEITEDDPGEKKSSKTHSMFQRKDQDVKHKLQIPHVRDLSLLQLEEYYERNSCYLWEIFKGEKQCIRHADYGHSLRKRRALDYQLNLMFYREDQVEHVVNLLKTLLAPAGDQKLDYILRVLLPEFLIKVYMDLNDVDYDTAELKMKPPTSAPSNDILMSYESL